jgi:hypothetical protein
MFSDRETTFQKVIQGRLPHLFFNHQDYGSHQQAFQDDDPYHELRAQPDLDPASWLFILVIHDLAFPNKWY